MAKVKVIRNGVEIEVEENTLDRPNNPPKIKKKEVFGRKDTVLIKWIASRLGITYQQALNQIDALDDLEPEPVGPS